MLKITSALFLSATLFTTAAHAIQEQQWGNWFGNTSGMEFGINADNDVGERMTSLASEATWASPTASQKELFHFFWRRSEKARVDHQLNPLSIRRSCIYGAQKHQ
jgi:hypothetical protein